MARVVRGNPGRDAVEVVDDGAGGVELLAGGQVCDQRGDGGEVVAGGDDGGFHVPVGAVLGEVGGGEQGVAHAAAALGVGGAAALVPDVDPGRFGRAAVADGAVGFAVGGPQHAEVADRLPAGEDLLVGQRALRLHHLERESGGGHPPVGDDLHVADWRVSPTGFPFKVVQ